MVSSRINHLRDSTSVTLQTEALAWISSSESSKPCSACYNQGKIYLHLRFGYNVPRFCRSVILSRAGFVFLHLSSLQFTIQEIYLSNTMNPYPSRISLNWFVISRGKVWNSMSVRCHRYHTVRLHCCTILAFRSVSQTFMPCLCGIRPPPVTCVAVRMEFIHRLDLLLPQYCFVDFLELRLVVRLDRNVYPFSDISFSSHNIQ